MFNTSELDELFRILISIKGFKLRQPQWSNTTLSLAGRLILLSLPLASWSLGSLPLIVRWTGYIWLRRHPTGTPQDPIHLEGCGLSRYFWPLKLTDVANEARQQRRCEDWSYIINPPGLEIQVIVQMEPWGTTVLLTCPRLISLPSILLIASLRVAAQWQAMPSLTEVGGSVMPGGAKSSLPTNPSRMPGKKLASRG